MPDLPTFIAPPVVILKFSLLFFIHFASEKKRNLLSLTTSRMKISIVAELIHTQANLVEKLSPTGNERSRAQIKELLSTTICLLYCTVLYGSSILHCYKMYLAT